MKRIIALILVLVITVCLFSACNTEKEPEPPKDPQEQQEVKDFGKIFYVAVDGSDENEGTKESPLATLGGAVAKVREYKAANGLPEGGIKVEFAAGTYKVTQQTDLTAEDSGEEGKEIVYAAADGAEVIFDGGISLDPSDFKPANDEFKALLQTDEAKANVLEIDLAAAGAWDLDDSTVYVLSWTENLLNGKPFVYRQTLYVNDEIQTVAQWPNEGFYTPDAVLANAVAGDDGIIYGLISVPREKANLWKDTEHLRFYGYPAIDWSSTFVWDIKLDPDNSVLYYPMHYDLGLEPECKFYMFNIAAELDRPGEYYWDVEAKKLYYWPEEGFEKAKISFSQADGSVISMVNTDFVTFDGFTFENLRYNAISSEKSTNSDHVTVSGSVFRCIAYFPVRLTGSDISVSDNVFYNLGGGAVYVTGGDIPSQKLSKTVVTNNLVHDWSQVYSVGGAGIQAEGMGHVLSHNELYNAPTQALAFGSGNTLVEYNHIYNVGLNTLDGGAMYSGRRWDWGNTVIRYNYIHDMPTSANGIYLDDTLAKGTCYGNIIANIGGVAFALGGGRNLTVFNNIMVNTGNMFLDDRGASWYPTWTSYPDGQLWKANINENRFTTLWKYMQPEFLSILEMRTTEELRDLRGISSDILDSPAPPAYARIYNNVVYINNYTLPSDKAVDYIDDPAYQHGYVEDFIRYTENPEDVFVDPANGNFFLKEDSRVYRDIIGFEKWDYSLIGPQK